MLSRAFNPNTFLAKVSDGKTVNQFQPGQIVFKQGEAADAVCYLISGRVKETVSNAEGREVVVGILEPGHFFGTDGIEGGVVRLSSVTAVRLSTVTMIENKVMKRLLAAEPTFAQLFTAYLLHHNTQIAKEKIDLLFNSTEKRLAQLLLVLAHFPDGPPQPISPEITQEMLSDMVGTTRPRVNYFLTRFRKMGLIHYNSRGEITVTGALLTAVLLDKASVSDDEGPH